MQAKLLNIESSHYTLLLGIFIVECLLGYFIVDILFVK